MKTLEVTFGVQGFVRQHVEVPDDITPEQLCEMLKSGKAATSINPGGELIRCGETGKAEHLGWVMSLNNECEYNDFTVNEA